MQLNKIGKQLLFSIRIPNHTLSTFQRGECVSKETPKSNLDLELGFVKISFGQVLFYTYFEFYPPNTKAGLFIQILDLKGSRMMLKSLPFYSGSSKLKMTNKTLVHYLETIMED